VGLIVVSIKNHSKCSIIRNVGRFKILQGIKIGRYKYLKTEVALRQGSLPVMKVLRGIIFECFLQKLWFKNI